MARIMDYDTIIYDVIKALNDILDAVTKQELIAMTGLPETRVDEIFELYKRI